MSDTLLKKPFKKGDAGIKQSQASDPQRSVWVGASAGTGKTKVLVDRALRLMLPRSGSPRESATLPGKILCLTFTKTAAAEMSNRIYERLSGWAVRNDGELRKELRELIGAEPTAEIEAEARRLFARVLDTPGGLKFMTLHSFCQSVLKRFPIEAGLQSHFVLMDEQSEIQYLKECQHRIITETRLRPDSALAKSFNQLTLLLDSAAMADLMKQIMSKRSLLTEILKAHGDAEGHAEKTVAAVYRHLDLDEKATQEDVLARAVQVNDAAEQELKQALHALLQGSVTDQKKARLMQPWLEQKSQRIALFEAYCGAFFTGDGKVFASLATKAVVTIYPDILNVMQKEAERLDKFQKELCAVRLAEINAALLTVASAMVGHYERHKREHDKLDFDDLIIKTCKLLSEKTMVPWVLFKLDAGIDHILVDEAQDTSRNQWRVVEALSAEFFAGRGSREDTLRTLFVVGDEKQSIFSFQGADPYEFARMQRFFGNRVNEVQEGWEIFLEYSFRSTRTVLEVVDSVFKNPGTRKGVAERDVLHLHTRIGQAGVVELWPIIKTEKKAAPLAWQMPTEIEAGSNAASRLAGKIADTIKSWLDKKEMLASRARPIRAGDILILVQSRTQFVEFLIRALKARGVEVAGIDRITLTEEIVVMDLLALAQFALLPKDDLTLASLLKSPLVGLTEEELYQACYQRSGTLWSSLQQKNPALAAWLQGWVAKAGSVTPYAFFAEALNTPCFADKISGRRAFYGRLGFETQDAMDEFLNRCLHYEQSHTPSLQKFVNWFLEGKTEIKREQDSGRPDQVRIMTVHGAKGLQAPIVFLPDTVKTPEDSPKGRIRLIWPEDGTGVPLWAPRQEFAAPVYAARQNEAREWQEEEYRRLLYVALTRAEDRLYICGHHGTKIKSPKPNCWYSLVSEAFPATAQEAGFIIEGETEPLVLRRLEHLQDNAAEKEKYVEKKSDAGRTPLPDWVFQAPQEEPTPPRPLAPSKPDDLEPAAKGPLAETENWRFSRGILVHQILEILPQLPEDKREKALVRYLERPRLAMPPDQQKSFAAEVLAVLRHPEFAPIFGAGSRAEVPVVGFAGQKILSGQMDRLLVTDREVLIVDYKTNRPPPKHAEDVAVIYLKQMAAYRSIIQNVYPQHAVKCALLWTDGPLLMPISENMLDPYAP